MFESMEPTKPEEFTFKADPADLCNRLGSLVMAAAHTLSLGISKEDSVNIIEDTIIALVESLISDEEEEEAAPDNSGNRLAGYVIINRETGSIKEITYRLYATSHEAEEAIKMYVDCPSKYDSEPVFISKGATK